MQIIVFLIAFSLGLFAWSIFVAYTTWLVRDCWTHLEARAAARAAEAGEPS